jgi:antitoxin component of MazEF toxin-antitoxin module
MSDYIGTVIKAGNSYAVRVPKEYLTKSNLEVGQKVRLAKSPVVPKSEFDHQEFAKALKELQALGPFKSIEDPVAWQREIRKDRPLPGRD